ncbi:TIGR03086 family metal-binding protein [Nocardioides insulae]|uniref:TIGR03086 family metal-binding protein n=1 Tax=Nocardioides insulae TaxID=394734 RepID=UPI000404BB14|nr:TIGR03086 family metal-binding protein [Nocardioides insulae]
MDQQGIPDLGSAGATLSGVVRATPEAALDAPTPCAEWSVRDLLAHIDGLLLAFRAAADKDLGPLTDTDPAAAALTLADGWLERIPARVEELVAAWRSPEAWSGATRAGGVDLPGEVAGLVALDEMVLHGWDLARAIGAPFAVDGATAEAVHAFAAATAAEESPIFAAPVAVPDTADILTRAVGLAGRDPDWSPPG